MATVFVVADDTTPAMYEVAVFVVVVEGGGGSEQDGRGGQCCCCDCPWSDWLDVPGTVGCAWPTWGLGVAEDFVELQQEECATLSSGGGVCVFWGREL